MYVADPGNHRVQVFTGEGSFLLMFGKEVNKTAVTMGGTEAEQDVCTAVSGDECQAGVAGSASGAFTTPSFVAIDPKTNAVYVADTADDVITKFDGEGVLEEAWGTSGQLDGSTTIAGSFGPIAGIATSTAGALIVLNTVGTGSVFEFKSDSTFTSELAVKGEFGVFPDGLGVNAAGDLFKNGEGFVEELSPTGEEIGLVTSETDAVGALSVNPEGELYFVGSGNTLQHVKFNGAGEVTEPGGATCPVVTTSADCQPTDSTAIGFEGAGIAATTAGDSYISNATAGQVSEFGPLVTLPDVETGVATELRPTSIRLNGSVTPDEVPVTDCVFEYGTTTGYGQEAACEAPDAAEIGEGTEAVSVHADIAGLTAGVTYHYRLRAGNKNGTNRGTDMTVETPPPPSVDSATVSSLTASSAVLNATIDPHASEARYHFEYDTRPYVSISEAAHGIRVPLKAAEDGRVQADVGGVSVRNAISGLETDTLYYWRVIATNESGTTTSVQHTFIYDTSGEGLPDDRAYEMVTPVHKNGALIGDTFLYGIQPEISNDGSTVIAPAIQCFADSQSCVANVTNSVGTPYKFTRTASGWVTAALAPPATQFTGEIFWWGYNANTGISMFGAPNSPPSGDGENDFYIRAADGAITDMGPNTAPEEGAKGPLGGKGEDARQANTPDFSHYAWAMKFPWPFEPNIGQETPYEYSGENNTRPLLVGVSGGEGSDALISECGATLGGAEPDFTREMMSADGRVVFFSALGGPGCHGTNANATVPVPADEVFARVTGETAEAHTVALSEPSPSECGAGSATDEVSCRAAAPAGAAFDGAAADGSVALFVSTQQLVDEASEDNDPADNAAEPAGCALAVGANGCNLYLYDLNATKRPNVVDVSAGAVSGGPRVQGVMAFSPDGSHVYFVAKGVLSSHANDRGEAAQDGANNLYVFEREGEGPGKIAFIADLPNSDQEEWSLVPGLPANISPEGRYLVFVSHGDLTADDTSASGAKQVFRYDAQTEQLIRLSIGNRGFDDDGNRSAPTPCTGGAICSEDARIAVAGAHERSDPTMDDEGSRVFFESPVGLTPAALNDVVIERAAEGPVYAQNVYEWEQEGTGSCPVDRTAGCVFLISDGKDTNLNKGATGSCAGSATVGESPSAVCLLGVDKSGDNVFFTTADPLVRADTNTELDYYDARVCEAENPCVREPPPASPGCSGEECHGIPQGVPGVTVAPSVSFSGTGNVTPLVPAKHAVVLSRAQKLAKALKTCRAKHNRARRRVCERQARDKYGAKLKSKRRASSKRRGVSRGGHR